MWWCEKTGSQGQFAAVRTGYQHMHLSQLVINTLSLLIYK